MATQNSLADLHNLLTQPQAGAAPAPMHAPPKPSAATKPASEKNSLANLHQILGSQPAAQPSIVRRAAEAVPGVKSAENFLGRQEDYWSGLGSKIQRIEQQYKSDPEIKREWEKLNAPIVGVEPMNILEGTGPKVRGFDTPEQFQHYEREQASADETFSQTHSRIRSQYRGLMEGLGNVASGMTSPLMLMTFLTGGASKGAEIVAEAGEAAEAQAGRAAIERGAAPWEGEKAAYDAKLRAEQQASHDLKYTQSLKDFTADKAMKSLMSAGFSAQMLMGIRPSLQNAEAQNKAGDVTGATKSVVDAVFGAAFGGMGILHVGLAGHETVGAWKGERDVKAALEQGSQDTYQKPWKDLSQEQKSKVVYDAVNKYGSEDAKKFHRTIAGLQAPPEGQLEANDQITDQLFDRAMANREAMDEGNRALWEATSQPAPQLTAEDVAYEKSEAEYQAWQEKRRPAESKLETREPLEVRDRLTMNEPPPARLAKPEGYDERKNRREAFANVPNLAQGPLAVVAKRRAEMDALPNPEKTDYVGDGQILNLPVLSAAERDEARRPERQDALRTLELEQTLKQQQEEAEADGAQVYKLSTPENMRQQILAEIQAGRLPENPESTGLEQINNQLDSMAAGLFPEQQTAGRTESAYSRLRQMQINGERLTDAQSMFMRQYVNRAALEKQLAGQIPDLKTAYDAAQEEGSTQAARSLVEAAQRLRELNDADRALGDESGTTVEEAALVADNRARAREFAEQRRTQMARAAVAIDGDSTPLKPGASIEQKTGNTTKIQLADGRQVDGHYAGVRIRDIRERVPGTSSVPANEYDPGRYLSTDPMAEAGPITITSDGRLLNGERRLRALEEAMRGPDRERLMREFEANLWRYGIESDGGDSYNPIIPARVMDADILTMQDLAQMRADLDRGPAPVPEPLPPTMYGAFRADDMDEVVDALKAMPDGSTLGSLLETKFGGDLVRKLAEKGVIPKDAVADLVGPTGELTQSGRNKVERILLSRALGGNVDDIPEAVLNKVAPLLGSLTRIGDGPSSWHVGDYLREAMRDLATIGDMRKALDRIGTSADSAVDKFYRPLNFRRGDAVFPNAPAEPHPITETMAKLLENGRGALLNDYAMAMDDRFRTQALPGSEFNRTVASKVGMEIAPDDWGTVKAATPEEKAERNAPKPQPTPEERDQQAHPTHVPEEIRRTKAVETVVRQAQEGTVTPEALREFFETDKLKRFEGWGAEMARFFGQVIPKATGLDLADFLKKAVAGVEYVPEILIDKRTGKQAAGLARFLDDGRALIQFSDKANVSTVVHEFFHVMRRYLRPEDLGVLEAYAEKAIKPTGQLGGIGEWGKGNDKDEVLARTWEKYLATGEAPNNTLKNIFNKLKTALRGLYRILGGEEKAPADSPLTALKSGAKIKVTPEVKAVFDKWFKEDDAKKPMKEPPKGPEAPTVGVKAPEAANPALGKQKAAQAALDAVSKQVEEMGLEDKKPAEMTPAEKGVYDKYKAAAKAAAEADEAVAKQPLAAPPGTALSTLSPVANKAIQKTIANHGLEKKQQKRLTKEESEALDDALTNHWDEIPLEYWERPDVREQIKYFRGHPGLEAAIDGHSGVDAGIEAMRQMKADGHEQFPNASQFKKESDIDELVGKLTDAEVSAWAKKEKIPETRSALTLQLKEMRRSVASMVAGLSSDADWKDMPLAMIQARDMIDENVGPLQAPEDRQLTPPPGKEIEGKLEMTPPPGIERQTVGSKESPFQRPGTNQDAYFEGGNWYTRPHGSSGKWVRASAEVGGDIEAEFRKGELGSAPGEMAPPPGVEKAKPAGKTAAGEMKLTQDWGMEHINGYSSDPNREEGNDTKDKFLRESKKYLDTVATELAKAGFKPYPDRKGKPGKATNVNPAGPAVSGEVSLTLMGPDGKGIHANIGDTSVGPRTKNGISIRYRANTDADRYGVKSPNKWAPVDLSATELAELFKKEAGVGKTEAAALDEVAEKSATATKEEYNTAGHDQVASYDIARQSAADKGLIEREPQKPTIPTEADQHLAKLEGIRDTYKDLAKAMTPPPEPYGPPLELTPFEGYSDRQLWEAERNQDPETDEERNLDAFTHVLKLRGIPDQFGTLANTVSAFGDTLRNAQSWDEAVAGVTKDLKRMSITGDDDAWNLARIAKHFLKGNDLFDALSNLATEMSGHKTDNLNKLLAIDAPPEDTGESEAERGASGQPENQPTGTAGNVEDVPSVPEPAREGGNAPVPVSAQGDQAAESGGNAGADAGRADAERVEHPGGQPAERGESGRSDGSGVAGDTAAGREAGGAGETGSGKRKPAVKKNTDKPVGADGKPVDTPRPEKPKAAKETVADLRNLNNYHISDEYAATIGSGGEITKIRGNLDALQTLKDIQESGREVATPEEQATLAKYVDFGGLVGMLQNYWKPEYKEHYERFKNLLSEAEIQEIKETLPNTHYTSLKMVDWMWKAMQKMGLKGGRILEPGMGIGNFFGRMPKEIGDKAELYGVERNPLTGAMAKLLYPDARIMVKPFQQVMVPDNSLDSIIGNVPFQDFAVTDDPIYRKLKLNLHNYFIVKSLDKLRPGGIAALITSRYTMDNGTGTGERARTEMAKRADLIAAFRLPDKAFKGNAGTEVVADLLIFRKRAASDIPEGVPEWTKLEKITVKGDAPIEKTSYYNGRQSKYIENAEAAKDKDFHISKYFVDHPENVLGTHSKEGKMYGPGQYTVKAPQDFEAALEEAMKRIPAKAFGKVKEADANRPPSTLDAGELNFAPDDVKPGSFYRDKDGNILIKESGVGVKLPMELNSAAAKKHIGDAIDLRQQVNQLIQTQLSSSDDDAMREQQKALDKMYESYRKKYGSLNGPALQKVFGDDPEYPKLLALENIDPETKTVSKAAIFSKRVLAPYEPLRELPDDPKSAMLKVIAEKGNLDTALMAELLKKPEEEVIQNLANEGLIFQEPRSGDYSTADEYLSGHVREKLRLARQAADADPRFKANVEALEKVQPKDVTIHEIQPSLGQTWIPDDIYKGFIQHLAGRIHPDNITISRDQSGKWLVQIPSKFVPMDLENKWGTSRVPGHKLVQYAMNQQQPTIYDMDSDGKRVLNREATVAAREKLAAIKEEFRTMLRRAPQKVVDQLEGLYNETFGGYRQREFSGEHLNFPGMSEDWRAAIRGYQKASVWRILQEGRAGIFHAPGLGKTLTMAAAGMEARRLKLSRKNMYAVPNHMIPQWRADFKRFYPNSNVLAATDEDFTPQNRNKLMSRIATGDWDAVIVPHSQFDTLPMSPEWESKTINKRLGEYRAVLQDLDPENKQEEKTIKQIEKLMDKLESRLNDLNAKKKDNTISFDQMGIDMLFVDEAHLYKSMAVPTKMSGIGGVSSSASQRAFALEMKGAFLRQTHGGRGLVFGTGTPITNTIGELYIMNKYLAPEMLEEAGIRSFDDWVANFAQTVTQYEYAADGVTFKPKTTLSEFVNVPELSTMFRRYAEYLSKEAAKALSNLKEPEAKRNDVMVKITPVQEPLLDMIAARGKELTDHPPRTKEERQADNWLKLSSDARKISLDPRLYDPSLKDHPGSKVNRAVDIIKTTLDATKAKKGTVVVFSDFFQHVDANGKPDFNLFEDMKKKLVKKGIPADQIAIIHEAKNKEAKGVLFAKVNSGSVRVIFGSTDTMGIGTNIQNLLKAELHLDQPWRPDQVEQREGRIVRSGNQWENIDIHRFIAEPETGKRKAWIREGEKIVDGKHEEIGHWEEQDRPRAYDLQMYQQLARKASFQEQFLTGNYKGRTMEDVGGDVKLNSQMFALGKAMATGNPDALRKLKVENDLRTFELLERNFQIERSKNMRNLDWNNYRLGDERKKLASIRSMMATFSENAKEDAKGAWEFPLEIDGESYDRAAQKKLLETLAIEDLAGKTLKIAGLGTMVEQGEESVHDGKEWVRTPVYTFTDPSGEKTKIARNKNGEQSVGAMLNNFVSKAARLANTEKSVTDHIKSLEQTATDYENELAKSSPYLEKIEGMEREIAEIDQRLGVAAPHADQDDIVEVGDEEGEGGEKESSTSTPQKFLQGGRGAKLPNAGEDKLYQEALPDLSVLTPKEQESEVVASDGDLQENMASAKVKRFDSVPEAEDWLVNAAQGDKYEHNFKGSQIRKMPDGKALAVFAPRNPDVLYQEAPGEDLARLRRLYGEALERLSPFRDPASLQKDRDFIKYAESKLGIRPAGLLNVPSPENVAAEKQPGTVKSVFPEEVKRGGANDRQGTDQRGAAANDRGRVRNAAGLPGVDEHAAGPGGVGEDGAGHGGLGTGGRTTGGDSSRSGGGGAAGGRGGVGGSGRPVEPPLPYIQLRPPTRPRGAEVISPVQWKAHVTRLGLPAETPAPTVTIDPDIAANYSKYQGQLEQLETLASGLQQHDGVILSSPTGGGKTFISLGLVKQLQTPESRQLVVTKSRAIIKQRNGWRDAGKRYFDLDLEYLPKRKAMKNQGFQPGVYVTTYAELLKRPELVRTPWDLIVFDESAEARRWYAGSSQGMAAMYLSDVAKKAAYVSAATHHNALEMGYMTKLNLWRPGDFDRWAEQFGARKKTMRGSKPGQTVQKWARFGSDAQALIAVRDQLVKRGQFATQSMDMEGHTHDIALVQTTEHQRFQMRKIQEVFETAERFYVNQGKSIKGSRARALGAIYMKNYLERLKIPQMIELAKEARKQGWDVAMFSENKTGVKTLWKYLQPADEALGGELARKLPPLPDVVEVLEKELGTENLANYSGPATGARAAIAEVFRSGKKHFLYATYSAGGVGISFHDDSQGGVRPKLVIHLGLPWSGMMFNQANGRFWRYGTTSNVHSIFLVGDAHPEVDMILNKVMPRLNSIHASVRGLDNEDPLVRGMKQLTRADAYKYDLGFKAKYDMADYQPAKGAIPIKDWTNAKAHMPDAEAAKGKGMKYPEATSQPNLQSKLFQEADSVPERFLSPEESQAFLDSEEMMDAFAEGEQVPVVESETKDIDPGDRQLAAEQMKASVAAKVHNRGDADVKSVARNAGRNELSNILAAKWAGDAGAVREPKAGEPGWEMKGDGPEPEDSKEKSKKFRVMSALISGMEHIKAMTKKAGVPEIGRQIDLKQRNYRAWRNQYAGEFTAKLQDTLKRNGIGKDEFRQVWMAKEGKIAPANQRIASAVQDLTKLMNEIRKSAADKGINLNDYDENGRPVKIAYADIADKPNYMPHIFDYSEKIKVIDPESKEEQVFTLKELLGNKDLPSIRKERIVNGIVAKTGWAKADVERWIDEKKRKSPLAGNIERARTADLPFYRMDQGALIKYFTGTGEVFARTEQWGQGLEKLDAMISQIPDRTAARNVRNIMMDSLAPEPWSEWASDFYSVVTTAQLLTKMTFSPIKVPFHLIHTSLIMEQFKPLLKAILQVPGGWKQMKQFGLLAGAIQDGITSQMNMDMASKLNLSHQFLKYTGFNWLFEADRVIGAQTARNWMSDYLLPKLIKKAKNSGHIRQQLTDELLMTDKQIDEAIKRGRWTEDDFKHAAAAFTNRVMFTGDPTELPYLWRARSRENPIVDNFLIVARVSTALKSFQFKSAMLLKRQLIDEARQGNYRSWIPFLLAYPLAGAALRLTSGAAHAAVGDPRSLNNFEQQLQDLFDDPSIAKLAHLWLDSVASTTAQTMVSHVLDVLFFPPKEKRKAQYQRGKLLEDETKEFLGPYGDWLEALKTMIHTTGAAHDELTSDDEDKLENLLKSTGKSALDFTGEVAPVTRPLVPWAERQMGMGKRQYQMAPPP